MTQPHQERPPVRSADDDVVPSDANPNRPRRAWATSILDLRECRTRPLPLTRTDLDRVVTYTLFEFASPPTSAIGPGWWIRRAVFRDGTSSELLTATDPQGATAAIVFDDADGTAPATIPGLQALLRLAQRKISGNSLVPGNRHWEPLPVWHAAVLDPGRWLIQRDQPLPTPGTEAERDALGQMSAWASVGVTSAHAVRRWSRYHVTSPADLLSWQALLGTDWKRIEARAPYYPPRLDRSISDYLPPPRVAAWVKHHRYLSADTIKTLHEAGATPLQVKAYLPSLASNSLHTGRRGQGSTKGPHTAPLAEQALIALATTPGLTVRAAAAAAKAGLTGAEIRDLHTRGELDEGAVLGLLALAALRDAA